MTERSKPLTLNALDDLAKDEKFTFKGKEYVIPALSQQTAEKLAELAKAIQPAIDNEDWLEVIKFDAQYIATAMAEGEDKRTEELKKQLMKWPRRVLSHLSRYVTTTMQGPIDEAIIEEVARQPAKK